MIHLDLMKHEHHLLDMNSAYPHMIEIVSDDIDHMGHVNNAVYLKWVQEAVVKFWEITAPPEAVTRHLWVALQHQIRYRRPSFLDDNIIADVLADRMEGAKAFFTTVIRRGEEVIAECDSIWCCLDAASKRPARLARDIVELFIQPPKA